jgi:type 1 glutamine amidotransferase
MKTRVLVICGDAWHPAENIRRALESLCLEDFDFEFSKGVTGWQPERLSRFPIVIFAKANIVAPDDLKAWLTPEDQTAFFDYVRQGNGLIAIHAGTSRYGILPLIRALIGGTFEHHPDQCEVTMEPALPHPLTAGVAAFTVRDEHYFMRLVSADANVFLHSRSKHGVQPAGWTRAEGNSRVCVLTPGHNREVWRHPEFQKLLTNALRWVAKLN